MTQQTDVDRRLSCRYDRATGRRLTRDHLDTCTTDTCRGCKPCPDPHCVLCRREHTDHAHPVTCPECIGKVRADLDDITTAYAALATEATDGGRDGRLVAAAPIPGGNAQVLRGPTVPHDQVRTGSSIGVRTYLLDHHPDDPIPPLAVLASWEDRWRAHLGQLEALGPASLWSSADYLGQHLTRMAQAHGPGVPDFAEFADQVRATRAGLERALHDERAPQRGVDCFECGERLERRFHDPKPCTHSTPARQLVRRAKRWARFGYPELGPTVPELRAAEQPCHGCDQGGIKDPTAGVSWECTSCRREYTPGEYGTAVRRHLLENGADGDGWTHITMAAEAATTMTGRHIPAGTVRKWVERGKVATRVGDIGMRLVYWPDVADEAAAAVERARVAAEERRRKIRLEVELWQAVAAGEKPRVAGKRLGLTRARVRELAQRWADEGRLEFKRAPDLGWAVAS